MESTQMTGVESLDVIEALSQLEQNTPAAIKKLRAHDRLTVRVRIIAQPGDASRRHELKVQGVTGDISQSGCKCLFPLPLRVGDVYWLSLDRQKLDVPPLMARCLRCRLVREDAFEAGFIFFQNVDLPHAIQSDS